MCTCVHVRTRSFPLPGHRAVSEDPEEEEDTDQVGRAVPVTDWKLEVYNYHIYIMMTKSRLKQKQSIY